MNEDIVIRNFLELDRSQLSQLYLRSRQETFIWLDIHQFKLEDFDKDTEGEVIQVAEIQSKIVGFISAWEQDSFIHHLFVDSMFQGLGVGKKLLNSAAMQLKKPIKLKCMIENKKACQFYEKLGWKIENTIRNENESYHLYRLE